MNLTISTNWDITVSGYFNGKPCEVFEEYHIIIPKGKMTTTEFIESEEFQMLQHADFDVHSGGYS